MDKLDITFILHSNIKFTFTNYRNDFHLFNNVKPDFSQPIEIIENFTFDEMAEAHSHYCAYHDFLNIANQIITLSLSTPISNNIQQLKNLSFFNLNHPVLKWFDMDFDENIRDVALTLHYNPNLNGCNFSRAKALNRSYELPIPDRTDLSILHYYICPDTLPSFMSNTDEFPHIYKLGHACQFKNLNYIKWFFERNPDFIKTLITYNDFYLITTAFTNGHTEICSFLLSFLDYHTILNLLKYLSIKHNEYTNKYVYEALFNGNTQSVEWLSELINNYNHNQIFYDSLYDKPLVENGSSPIIMLLLNILSGLYNEIDGYSCHTFQCLKWIIKLINNKFGKDFILNTTNCDIPYLKYDLALSNMSMFLSETEFLEIIIWHIENGWQIHRQDEQFIIELVRKNKLNLVQTIIDKYDFNISSFEVTNGFTNNLSFNSSLLGFYKILYSKYPNLLDNKTLRNYICQQLLIEISRSSTYVIPYLTGFFKWIGERGEIDLSFNKFYGLKYILAYKGFYPDLQIDHTAKTILKNLFLTVLSYNSTIIPQFVIQDFNGSIDFDRLKKSLEWFNTLKKFDNF